MTAGGVDVNTIGGSAAITSEMSAMRAEKQW
jgi:hypothetical protein